MITSKELISSWTKSYIKAEPYKNIWTLKKQFFRTNLLKAIEFLRAFTYANVFCYREKTFYDFKKTTATGKLYLLPKIQKWLHNVPGRPIISNCGTPTEKVSEFLDFHLKPLMRSGCSHLRDSGDFIDKLKRIGKVPESSFLVTADMVGLYPSIPYKEGILALKSKLEEQTASKIPTNNLVKLADFAFKSNRSVVLLLGLSFLLHTPVFIWIK